MKISRYAIIIIVLFTSLFSGCITEDVIRSEDESIMYINATNIIGSGFASLSYINSSSNISAISEMNKGYIEVNESTGTGFNIDFYFYNITSFTHVDNTM